MRAVDVGLENVILILMFKNLKQSGTETYISLFKCTGNNTQ